MHDLLPFVVSGIPIGAIYGLAATGLVLTYKTSGIFNLGHGAIATLVAYLFYWLTEFQGWGTWPALAAAVLVGGPVIGLVLEQFARRLAEQAQSLKIVGTIGLVLLVQGLVSVKFGTLPIRVPNFIPGADHKTTVFGVVITYDQIFTTVFVLLVVTALAGMFRWTRTGLAMRAVVDDPELLDGLGRSPQTIRRYAWVIGATLAGASGVLIAPMIGLDAILLTYMVVQAFAAAAIGGFTSIPLTLAGGILVGVLSAVANKYALGHEALSGLPASIPFLLLFGVLLVRGRRLTELGQSTKVLPEPYRAPAPFRAAAGVVAVAVLLSVPSLVGFRLTYFTTALCTGILLLSLGLLVRLSGQVSLCHAAFAAVGAVAFSQLHVDHGVPWLVAVLLGSAIVVPVGALVAIPAVRLSGLFLALATFGFGILVQQLFFPQEWMFTPFSLGRVMPHPRFAESPQDYYYVVVAAFVLVGIAVVGIERSRLGRLLRLVSSSPRGAEAMGLTTQVARVVIFCISAFIAGLAGILLGVERSFATGSDPFYISFNSLLLLAMLALSPFASPWYALLPAVATLIPAYVNGENTALWLNVVFGASAIMVAMSGGNPTMPAGLRRRFERFRRRSTAPTASTEVQAGRRREDDPAVGLHARELTVRFGGLTAVKDLTFSAEMGTITGLIGPNGAGKTSTFDACSGFNRRVDGVITLWGQTATRFGPARRARAGLGRTFQLPTLCEHMTVRENVEIGYEAGVAGWNPATHVFSSRTTRRVAQSRAASALEVCGIVDLADVPAALLSTGQRRLVELARCLTGDFRLLLLDEPSAGLDPAETERFAAVLREVVATTGAGVLIIEHDMSLVMDICSQVYVLDFGEMLFAGTPDQVSDSDSVRRDYLGEPLQLGEPVAYVDSLESR